MSHDRHGRARRADGDRLRRPPVGFHTRDQQRFVMLVRDVLTTLPRPLREALQGVRVRAEDVPPAGELDLARLAAGELLVYRRPCEARAQSRPDLQRLLRSAIGREVAGTLGRGPEFADEFDDPDDWDDDLG
jgi:hypothetical protein